MTPTPRAHEEHPGLFAALAAFQQDMPVVVKADKARVETKSGPAYSYTYATLADVVRVTAPLLGRHGLAFTCHPARTESGALELVGTLTHETGGTVAGVFPLFGSTPQQLGSAITYGRRYLFGCLTGVVTDDDDDAAAAQQAPPTQVRTARDARADLARYANERGLDLHDVSEMWAARFGSQLREERSVARIDQFRADLDRIPEEETTSQEEETGEAPEEGEQ